MYDSNQRKHLAHSPSLLLYALPWPAPRLWKPRNPDGLGLLAAVGHRWAPKAPEAPWRYHQLVPVRAQPRLAGREYSKNHDSGLHTRSVANHLAKAHRSDGNRRQWLIPVRRTELGQAHGLGIGPRQAKLHPWNVGAHLGQMFRRRQPLETRAGDADGRAWPVRPCMLQMSSIPSHGARYMHVRLRSVSATPFDGLCLPRINYLVSRLGVWTAN